MRIRKPFILLLVTLAAAPLVPRALRACGPYFALDVLPTRSSAVLKPPPPPSLADGLVPKPGDRLPVVEGDEYDTNGNDSGPVLLHAERAGLPADAPGRIIAMRALVDGEAAYAAGEGLPEAVRAYTAGAVSFHNGQFDQAQHYFERVLALNPSEGARELRAVWASYMLGTVARLQGNSEAAAAHWATTRGLVRSGLPDPLGLAVASFGEEARLYLQPGTITKAVALYARQAAYGSENGRASLLQVAEQVLKDPAQLEEVIDDPTTRRLVLRYLYAHGTDDTASLDRVLDAFERHRVSNVDGADLLAAATYVAGRFDAAERLAAYQKTPLSAWITGKLALRRGDRQAALASFSEAVSGMPSSPANPANKIARGQAQADVGILRVSAGEYAQAMELFYRAVEEGWFDRRMLTDYWADLAYLAERVLTIDELLPVVDRLAPAPPPAAFATAEEHQREMPAAKLRVLAARRLMRAGRYREALRYFEPDEHLRRVAEDYIKAVTKASSRWRSPGTRAEAWFTAATIARHDGMELLGYELDPDFALYDGLYDRGTMPPGSNPPDEPTPNPKSAEATAATTMTPDERARVTASKPPVASRFQYRLTAVDHALASADLIPRRSQAFAAVMCRATEWIIDREPERAAQIYARYIHEGPLVPWASHFGRDCPAPDFASAEHRRWQERVDSATWIFTSHPRRTVAAVTLLMVVGGAAFTHRRRRMTPRIT